MTFIARSSEFKNLAAAREALFKPAPVEERFDPEHPVMMRCSKCGKHAFGPRKHMAEAIREHQRSVCPARKTKENEPQVMRIFYPQQ